MNRLDDFNHNATRPLFFRMKNMGNHIFTWADSSNDCFVIDLVTNHAYGLDELFMGIDNYPMFYTDETEEDLDFLGVELITEDELVDFLREE